MRKLNEYSCQHCSKTFATNFSLVRHQLVHTQIKPFKCDFCPKTFALAQYKREHEFIHTNLKPFVCGVNGCTESFRQRGKLSLHRRTHNGYNLKKYKLQGCAKTRRAQKKKHQFYEDESEAEDTFECCGSSTTLETHDEPMAEELPLPTNPLLLLLRAHEDLEKNNYGYTSYDGYSSESASESHKVELGTS